LLSHYENELSKYIQKKKNKGKQEKMSDVMWNPSEMLDWFNMTRQTVF
jgi:hypothetical protein